MTDNMLKMTDDENIIVIENSETPGEPADKNELLIIAVQERPSIYNINSEEYKNTKLKNDHWAAIAEFAGLADAKEARDKWKSLRDGYRNHKERMRNVRSGSKRKKIKTWKYAALMEFMDDYMGMEKPTESNIPAPPVPSTSYTKNSNVSDEEDEDEIRSGDRSGSRTPSTRKNLAQDIDKCIIQYLHTAQQKQDKEKRSEQEDDPLKLYFLTAYHTVKKFKKINQLKVKKALNSIIQDLEEEEELLENNH